MIAYLRFAIFVAVVLGVPAVLMAAPDAGLVDLGKLTMILSPAIAGLALSPRQRERGSKVRWVWVARAPTSLVPGERSYRHVFATAARGT